MKLLVSTALLLSFGLAHAAEPESLTLPNGVKITYVKKGAGAKPLPTQTVRVHYEGKLLTGEIFDSSYKRGTPVSFPLNQVIPCWTSGVSSIPVGSTVELRCPSETAYGERGVPGRIQPNSTLIFKVELLAIEK